MSKPAVLLDRDGVLLEEVGYLDRLERLRVFPWSVDAVRLLVRAGFEVVVVSNQAGVARGYFDESVVRAIHDHLAERFRQGGAPIAGFYYCPHHPTAAVVPRYLVDCNCRKPKPGMALRAERDLGLDLRQSYVVGDRWLDMGLAAAIGARGILVKTGYGATEASLSAPPAVAAHVAEDLAAAVSWILLQQRVASDPTGGPSGS